MEYTQGEWKARKLLVDKHGIINVEAWEITTPEYDVATYISHSAPIRREADANLIAASKDLYEALKVAIAIIEVEHIVVPIKCRNAITKAEGG